MVTVAFIRCFSCFSWFSCCRGNCICAGQGNTVVSHFVVQRDDFTVAIACVPCGPRRSLIYAWEWGFCVCWKLSAAEKVKPDCCRTPAVVSTLLTPLPVSCPLTTPHHYIYINHFFPLQVRLKGERMCALQDPIHHVNFVTEVRGGSIITLDKILGK